MDIKIAGEQHGLDWCIIRPHNIYGEKQNIWDKYRNVLGIWMYQTLNDKPMLIYGDGEQTRAFTYVGDNLKCLWNAATKKEASHEIINLGGITPYTINEAANILCKITGYNKIEHVEARYEVKWAVPTYQKSIDILEFEDKTLLINGLSNMWEWCKTQPKREQFILNCYEINKGLYSYWKK
jgi:UDP-glucose 4-epimerase